MTGEIIDKAIELCETDNPRDNDTRSPAQRRGEALADVCGFYVDHHKRISADPDAEARLRCRRNGTGRSSSR